MRAPPLILGPLCLLVALVAAGAARAELPHLVLRLAADAEHALGPAVGPVEGRAHEVVAPLVPVHRGAPARLAMTGAALVPPPPKDVAAVTRVEGLAVRALQPRLQLQSPVVHAVKLTPMWPLGAHVTLEYTLPLRR